MRRDNNRVFVCWRGSAGKCIADYIITSSLFRYFYIIYNIVHTIDSFVCSDIGSKCTPIAGMRCKWGIRQFGRRGQVCGLRSVQTRGVAVSGIVRPNLVRRQASTGVTSLELCTVWRLLCHLRQNLSFAYKLCLNSTNIFNFCEKTNEFIVFYVNLIAFHRN